MKKHIRLLSLLLVVVMLLPLASCGNDETVSGDGSAIVMSYGDFNLSEKDYMYIVSLFKTQLIDTYQGYFSQYGVSYSEEDILAMQMSEELTFAQYIEEVSIEFSQQMLIFEQLCKDAGITITDQEDIDMVNGYLEDMEYAYGGEDLFNIELTKLGLSRSSIERYLKANILYELIFDYRYGENGVAAVPAEKINEYFLANYYHYDGALYAYADYSTGEDFTFEFTDAEIATHFAEDYVKVRHILYKTVDKSNKKLPEDKIAEKKAKAEAALAALQSGEKVLDDFKSETEDSGYEYIFTYGSMVEAFEKASFEMEIGEFRVVETEYGFHVIEKLEKTDEDLNGKPNDKGELTGGYKKAVIASLSSGKIRSEALDLFDKLKSGEVKEYPTETDAKPYYLYLKPSLIDKNETTYASFIELVSGIKTNEFAEKNFADEATYIVRRLPLTVEDMTADIYASIEDDMAFEEFGEYVRSFYDKVQVNNELLDKFDVVTIKMLDENLYLLG